MERILLEIVKKNDENKELLQDYWLFKDSIKFDFVFTAKSLIYKYNLDDYTGLTKKIMDAGGLLVRRLKDCKKCYIEFNIEDRAHFKNSKFKILNDTFICYDCRKVRNNKKVNSLIYDIKNHNCRVSEGHRELLQLSYIEKIYLYILIENYRKNFPSEWNPFSISSYAEGKYLIKNIIEKGYIKELEHCNVCYTRKLELYTLCTQEKNMIEEHLIEELKSYLKLNFNYHCHVIVPKGFESIESWMSNVYSEILKTKLTIDDVREVESFVVNKRFNEVYKLISLVCEKNLIPFLKDNAFDFDVLRMARNYNLEVIFNLLTYCAENTKSELYLMNELKDYESLNKKKHIYRKYVSSRLEKLLKNNYPVLYTKNLPNNWVFSEEELFVNTYIIEGDQRWSTYTPKEILNMWLDKTIFDFEE